VTAPSATVARFNVTPIKGTSLAHPATVELTALGIRGNRRFHLVDARGWLFSGGAHGPLVRLSSAFDPTAESLTVTFPDGTVVATAADHLGAGQVTDFYGRPVPGRFLEGPLAEAISGFVGRPLRLVRTDVEGDGCDEHHLTLVSWASVRDLGTRYARPDLDPLRFRMNLELDGCEAFEEDAWAGRAVRVGEAVVRVLGPVPRCVVTTQDPATGVKDFDTLKRIAEFRPLMTDPRGVPFGVYAEVERPGRAAVGDPVEPLGGPPA
jgi:uncharacterized protein YcbX